MPCGNKLMVLQVSRLLEVQGCLAEVSDRVVGRTRHLPGRVPARGRMVVRVTQLDQVVVPVEAALRPRARQVTEAEAEAAVHRHRVLRVVEVEAGILSRLALPLEAVRVVALVHLVVALLGAHLSLRDRRAHQMTLQIFLMEVVSESLRLNVVRLVSLRQCLSHSSG